MPAAGCPPPMCLFASQSALSWALKNQFPTEEVGWEPVSVAVCRLSCRFADRKRDVDKLATEFARRSMNRHSLCKHAVLILADSYHYITRSCSMKITSLQ